MIHCENDALVSAAREKLIAAGKTGLAYHGQARPALAEIEAANRALFLARTADERGSEGAGERRGTGSGVQVYVVHCSASGTVDQVTLASAQGQRAIAETTVQYLLLDETMYAGSHPEWGIMQPPLREKNEKILLWNQLTAGAIRDHRYGPL